MKNFLTELGLAGVTTTITILLCGLICFIIKDNRVLEIICCSVVSLWTGIIYSAIHSNIFED